MRCCVFLVSNMGCNVFGNTNIWNMLQLILDDPLTEFEGVSVASRCDPV
jgi:hypothetical protein